MNQPTIKRNIKSPRLISMFNRNKNYWAESETDRSSSISDNDRIAVSSIASSDNNSESSKTNCCLICSILPSLSNVNCCPKHLTLLSKTLPSVYPSPIVYMMHPAVKNCHCSSHCSKSKRRRQSSSSSSTSASSRRRRKKRSVAVQSSFRTQQKEDLLSPNDEDDILILGEPQKSTTNNQKCRLKHVHIPLSTSSESSYIIKTNMNNNNSRQKNKILSTPIVKRTRRRTANQKESIVQQNSHQSTDQATSSNLTGMDLDVSYSPRILLNRVVHVKEDGDVQNSINPQIILNMSQATKQMINVKNTQPKILLKRVCFDKRK